MNQAHPDLMDMLRNLIAAPSMSSVSPEFDTSNREVIDMLADWLEALGFSVEIMPLPNQPHKANLLASIGARHPESQGLMLAGHTDTVPYDAQHWNHDPFKLTEANNRFYGLGTSDMKSFFALAIEAVKQFDPKHFKQPLFLLATADEESSMEGAQMLVERGCPGVRYAVIGEPTNLIPVNAHKGIMMEAIRLVGHSGHSSDPSLGVSALEAMNEVISDILDWRKELQHKYKDHRFTVPVPTLNLGHIHGGDNPNRICGECELHIDLRPLPGMMLDELRQQIEQRLEKRLGGSQIHWELRPLFHGTPPLHTADDSAIVREAQTITKQTCESVSFCTEGPYLKQLGIDTIILGPGNIAQAHQPDEYLAMSKVQPMIDVMCALIRKFCF